MSPFSKVPAEVLCHILSYLAPIDWDEKLRQDPSDLYRSLVPGLPKASACALKEASLVNTNWRRAALPLLYRHVIWTFECLHPFYKDTSKTPNSQKDDPDDEYQDSHEEDDGDNEDDGTDGFGFLSFLHTYNLEGAVQSLTIIIPFPKVRIGREYVRPWDHGVMPQWGLYVMPEMRQRLMARAASCSYQYPEEAEKVEAQIQSLFRLTTPWDNNWLWHQLFKKLSPTRVTLISSPLILSSFLSGGLCLGETDRALSTFWALSLSVSTRAYHTELPSHLPSLNQSGQDNSVYCDLFSIRDWDSMILNEGYSIDSFPPGSTRNNYPTLINRLFDDTDASLKRFLHKTLRSISYVAVCPSAHTVGRTFCEKLPPVSKLYLQIGGHKRKRPPPIWLNPDRTHSFFETQWDLFNRVITKCLLSKGNFMTVWAEMSPAWHTLQELEWGELKNDCVVDSGFWDFWEKYDSGPSERAWKIQESGVLVRIP
ncbi:hypothetical protein HJFPF1_03922 [Paramyrothecium foliicola]|nr:hypothetical protein HJFPF1_03922 [Paramyrothecium foliicola]